MKQAIQTLIDDEAAEVDEGSAWTCDDIAAFHAQIELRLPERLLEYLTQFGTVFFESPRFAVTFPSGSTFKTELDRIGDRPDKLVHDTKFYLDQYNTQTGQFLQAARIPKGYIIVGEAEGKRSKILMDGVNVDSSAIYLWGISYDPWGEGDNTMGLGHVSDDLADWLGVMAEDPYGQ
ncbi:hypothetical protein [Jannaschia sp. LMIT008]|uniref:hypothetical protein n=1 Tax=Jannaschia maritima TaxID=3032585 RepID=UPI00281215BD|nr:hypothetical protein [Jannaschia sp. LMIT008]